MDRRTYVAIDLKSFYASAECVALGYDPLSVNLVVADAERTEKTICLAVSPSLKACGIPGRARLFEVVQKVEEINALRRSKAPNHTFTGKSFYAKELNDNPSLELDYVVASPRLGYYMQVSADIFSIYMKYVSPEDIHVYSIDEVFIDATAYLKTYSMNAHDFTMMLVKDVLFTTGITATAGIGTNMYLCKIAMDIVAKKIPPDENGVRIAELDEMSYRRQLWSHRPLTDFWRVGRGYARKLEAAGLYTMGDVARCSLTNEDWLYKTFGVNAELLIDHAWGWESCTIADIHAYKPENNSVSSGQVLHCPYDYQKGRLIVREMTDLLVLDLVDKELVTDQLVLSIGYDIENLTDPERRALYKGPVVVDYYGRRVPKSAHGSVNLPSACSSTKRITEAVMALYDSIADPDLLIRRVNVTANHVSSEHAHSGPAPEEQLDLFTDYAALEKKRAEQRKQDAKEKQCQKAILSIQKRFGKNALLKGMNLEEGATTIQRNGQVGGHKAW